VRVCLRQRCVLGSRPHLLLERRPHQQPDHSEIQKHHRGLANSVSCVTFSGQGRVIEQPQTESRPTPQTPQDHKNGDGRGQNSAPAAGRPSQDRPADEAPRAQERNVPRPPERNMSESSTPAQAASSQPRGNSADDPGRGNGNYSAQPRSTRQAGQPSTCSPCSDTAVTDQCRTSSIGPADQLR